MADIDTGKIRANAAFLERKGWSKSAVLERAAADTIESLSRELAEAKEQLAAVTARDTYLCTLLVQWHDTDGPTPVPAEAMLRYLIGSEAKAKHQLAESERMAAARNKLNGELAQENERLRALLIRARNSTIPHSMRFDIDAALTAPASGGAT